MQRVREPFDFGIARLNPKIFATKQILWHGVTSDVVLQFS